VNFSTFFYDVFGVRFAEDTKLCSELTPLATFSLER